MLASRYDRVRAASKVRRAREDQRDRKGGKMNRRYLLDSLDGFKSLVFRLLPDELSGSIACVPMTTDDPWCEAEKNVFEKALGITSERMFWKPGGFDKVPPSGNRENRSKWVDSIAAINYPYLFLDPDTASSRSTMVNLRSRCRLRNSVTCSGAGRL